MTVCVFFYFVVGFSIRSCWKEIFTKLLFFTFSAHRIDLCVIQSHYNGIQYHFDNQFWIETKKNLIQFNEIIIEMKWNKKISRIQFSSYWNINTQKKLEMQIFFRCNSLRSLTIWTSTKKLENFSFFLFWFIIDFYYEITFNSGAFYQKFDLRIIFTRFFLLISVFFSLERRNFFSASFPIFYSHEYLFWIKEFFSFSKITQNTSNDQKDGFGFECFTCIANSLSIHRNLFPIFYRWCKQKQHGNYKRAMFLGENPRFTSFFFTLQAFTVLTSQRSSFLHMYVFFAAACFSPPEKL